MTPREKGAAIKDWTAELLAEFRGERKDAGAERWRARMLEQRMRAEPAAQILMSSRRLKPHEKAAAWDEIKAAEKQVKNELKAAAPPDFRAFLEVMAETDPKARAVLTHEQAKDERKAKIKDALDAEARAIEAIRATAPQGERDPAKAARDAKDRLKAENEANQQRAKEARRAADEAAGRVAWWHGKNSPTRIGARDAARQADALEWTARTREPTPTDFREEAEKAEQRAGRTARAYGEWQRGPGQEADRRNALLRGVKSALKAKDGEIWRAMDKGGYAEAARVQAQREAEEQRKREQDRKVIPLAVARQQREPESTHALPAPKMR
jgi:hypothetical protein